MLAFWQDPIAHPPPGSESIWSLQQRIAAQLQQWFVDSAGTPDDARFLCITHGGVIRTLVRQLLGVPITAAQQLSIDYGSISRIELYPEGQPDGPAQPFQAQLFLLTGCPSWATMRLNRYEI